MFWKRVSTPQPDLLLLLAGLRSQAEEAEEAKASGIVIGGILSLEPSLLTPDRPAGAKTGAGLGEPGLWAAPEVRGKAGPSEYLALARVASGLLGCTDGIPLRQPLG